MWWFTLFLSLLGSHAGFASDNANEGKTEAHFYLCDQDERALVDALGFSRSSKEDRQVYYFDTQDTAFYKEKFVLRARTTDAALDFSIKILDSEQEKLKEIWQQNPDVECEKDLIFGSTEKTSQNCTFKIDASSNELTDLLTGKTLWDVFLSGKPKEFAEDHSLPDKLVWTELKAFGPISVAKWKGSDLIDVPGLVLEIWNLKNGEKKKTLIELSFKAKQSKLKIFQETVLKFVSDKKITACPLEKSKTQVVLDFMSLK